MAKFTSIMKTFINSMARSKVSLVGATITTAAFPLLLVGIFLELFGAMKNEYFSFVLYMFLAPLFLLGLLLVLLGNTCFQGKKDTSIFAHEQLSEAMATSQGSNKARKILLFIVCLTIINVIVMVLLSYTGYHYVESNAFCGKLCHTVMEPEYTAHANSPHASIRCVDCHIGSGAQWFVKSKISGTRQLLAVATGTYDTPIKTPVHTIRPADETCGACHQAELNHGDKLLVKDKFLQDENNTHVQTVLLMKLGSGGQYGTEPQGIHWHAAPGNQITYTHTDPKREQITQVTLTKPDSTRVIFDNGEENSEAVHIRQMDCIDCHNRPAHIYRTPDEALDEKLLSGAIPRDLPFIKKIGYELISKEYPSQAVAKTQIAADLRNWYNKEYSELIENDPALLETAIAGVQAAYTENVWPKMNISWNTYPSLNGHQNDSGCFRCHDDEHENSDGDTISMDCETCHIILAEEEEEPEILQTLQGY